MAQGLGMTIGRHGYRGGVPASGLRRLRGTLLIQAGPAQAAHIARWADRPGGGLVLTGRDGLSAAQALIGDGFSRPVLVDAGRYRSSRVRPKSQLSQSWVDWQRAAGLPAALTDTGYIAHGDGEALHSVLDQAACLGPGVVAVLPLHASWLVDDIERLCAEVAAVEIPVAPVIESGGDPFAVMASVEGLLRLVSTGVPVIMLRADVSGLGMLCFGGYAAAVGLRHNLRRGPVRRGRQEPLSVLVPQLLRFVELDRLDAAMLADPESGLWHCDCEVCAGTELSWFGMTGGLPEAADAHAIAALLRLREAALAAGAGTNLCRDQWGRRCAGALRRHAELAAVLYGLPPQPALNVWVTAAGRAGLGQQTSANSLS
ncbi:MAG TPA: hypothetical protein VGJ95_15280 [Pseudonocardiaceae bacterium]|jgi:hypothetical protein